MHGLYVKTLFDFGKRTEDQMCRRDNIQHNFIHDKEIIYKAVNKAT